LAFDPSTVGGTGVSSAIGQSHIYEVNEMRQAVFRITAFAVGLMAICLVPGCSMATDRPRSFITIAAEQLAAAGFVGSAVIELSPVSEDTVMTRESAVGLYDQLIKDGFEFVPGQSILTSDVTQDPKCAVEPGDYFWMEMHGLNNGRFYATNVELARECTVRAIVVMVFPTRGPGD